jgi:hypothetical protein
MEAERSSEGHEVEEDGGSPETGTGNLEKKGEI